MSNLIAGLDISVMQGTNIPWSWLVGEGYQFVICRNYVGNNGKDTQVENYLAQAKNAGLAVGIYNFIFPLPHLDPAKQAQTHFNSANKSVYAHCIDCEWPTPRDFAKWNCNAHQINEWMLAYFQEYEQLLGHKPMLYTYPDWSNTIKFDPSFAQYPLWIASYAASPYIPKPWGDWSLWQNSSGPSHFPSGVTFDHDFAKDLSLFSAPAGPVETSVPNVVTTTPPDPPPVAPAPTPTAPVPVVAPAPVVPTQPSSQRSIFVYIWNALFNFFKPVK